MPTIARPFIAVLAITAAITTTKGTMEIALPPYLAGYGYALSLIGFLTSLIAVLPLVSAAVALALPPVEAAPFPIDRGVGIRGLLSAGARLDSRVWLAFVIVLYLNVVMDSVDTFFPVFAPTIGISLAIVGVLRAVKSGAPIFVRSTGVVLLHAVDYRRVTVVAVLAAAAATAALH